MARRRSPTIGFEQRLLRSLRASGVRNGDGIVVGFSGGVDSLALAMGLAAVSPVIGLQVHLVHVDHGIRPSSEADSIAARSLAGHIGLALTTVRLPSGSVASKGRGGIENVARQERYRALAAVAVERGFETIALGHQANDQLESILLHLVRGAGTGGLAGMAAVEHREIPWWTTPVGRFRIVRPMLTESRSEIHRYVRNVGLQPVRDESNDDQSFDRNWLRLQVVPNILSRWPAAAQTVARAAPSVRDDNDLLDRMADELAQRSIADDNGLGVEPIRAAPPALARRVIRHWLERFGIEQVTIDSVNRCLALVQSPDPAIEVEVGSGIRVVVDGNYNLRALHDIATDSSERIPMVTPGDDERWDVAIVPPAEADAVVTVKEDDAIHVRTLRQGDRWSRTNRSVREDLRRAGISPVVRDRIILVADAEGVLLVPAIYPLIRSVAADGASREVGVRWRKKS